MWLGLLWVGADSGTRTYPRYMKLLWGAHSPWWDALLSFNYEVGGAGPALNWYDRLCWLTKGEPLRSGWGMGKGMVGGWEKGREEELRLVCKKKSKFFSQKIWRKNSSKIWQDIWNNCAVMSHRQPMRARKQSGPKNTWQSLLSDTEQTYQNPWPQGYHTGENWAVMPGCIKCITNIEL